MGSLSPWHLLVLALILLLVFGGKGRLSGIMGDAAKGIKAFKEGLKDEDKPAADASKSGTLPRTDAEKEAIAREEAKHST